MKGSLKSTQYSFDWPSRVEDRKVVGRRESGGREEETNGEEEKEEAVCVS